MMTSYLEEMAHDPALRAFVDAQRGQDAVALAALRVEHQHAMDVIAAQRRQLAELQPKAKARCWFKERP